MILFPSARYPAIPTSTDEQATPSNVPEAGVNVGGMHSAMECIRGETETRWTYFLLGCAILLPWNAMANATSFFLSKVAGSPLYSTFSSYWASGYMLTKLGCQFYCTFTSKRSSPSRRIFASITAMIFLVASLCLSTFIRATPSGFFTYALLTAAFTAVASGYLVTAVYAQAALLGTSFLQVVFSGQAAVAVAISMVQVVSSMIALWGSSPGSVSIEQLRSGRDEEAEEISARIFFGISTVFLCAALTAYTWLTRKPLRPLVTNPLERHSGIPVPDELTRLITDTRRHSSTVLDLHVYRVFRQNLIFMFSLAYVFVVTLSVSPTVTARVQPVNPNIHPMLFTAMHFLIFNTGDLLGRYSCSFPRFVVWSGEKILAMSLLRTLFIPLVLLSNVNHTTSAPSPPILNSDILFMILILTMGYTNGYVSSLALLAVSSVEHNPRLKGYREDVDVAATLGGSFIIVGLAVGALCSFGVQAMT